VARELFERLGATMTEALPLFAPHPAPLVEPPAASVVFVRREETIVVRSCASSEGHQTLLLTSVTIAAHAAPYRCRRGERRVRPSELTEAQRIAALLAYQDHQAAR